MDIDFDKICSMIMIYLDEKVSAEKLTELLSYGKQVSFEKGDLILGIGEKMKKVYFILQGITRSYYLDIQGNDVTKSFMYEYSFCLSESFFTKEKSIQGFEALEKVVALEFNAEQLKDLFLSDEKLRSIYIKMLEATIIYKMNRESSFQLKTATERYLDFIKDFPKLEERVNQNYISSYLGITAVSLSRIRRSIREEN